MSFFGKLLGTDKATSKIIDTVGGLVDNAFYTDQEEAEHKRAAQTEARGFIIEWLKSTTGSRLARRIIALNVMAIWTLQFLSAKVVGVYAVWADPELVSRLNETINVINENGDQINGATMLILAFYFAAPHMGAIVEGALNKFGGTKNTS